VCSSDLERLKTLSSHEPKPWNISLAMVVIIAAAAVAAGVGAYKGGKMAVAGVKKKVENRKRTTERNNREKGYLQEKQQVETERQARLEALESMRSGSRDTTNRLIDVSNTNSIKERLADYKNNMKVVSACTSSKSTKTRFSMFKKRNNQD